MTNREIPTIVLCVWGRPFCPRLNWDMSFSTLRSIIEKHRNTSSIKISRWYFILCQLQSMKYFSIGGSIVQSSTKKVLFTYWYQLSVHYLHYLFCVLSKRISYFAFFNYAVFSSHLSYLSKPIINRKTALIPMIFLFHFYYLDLHFHFQNNSCLCYQFSN